MNQISNVAANFPASGIRAMFDLAAHYPGFMNLCNGEPNFETPDNIKQSACDAIWGGMTKYSPEPGLPVFRQAVADKYTKQFGVQCKPTNVCAALGGVEGVMLSLMTIMNPGDEIIVPNPSYTCYPGQVEVLGGKVVRVPLYEKDGFKLQPEVLEAAITDRTKAVVLNYPNNPIGAVLTMEDAEKLADVIEKHNIYVISDEVYEVIVFDGRKHLSLAQVPRIRDKVIIVNSLSKTYAMTGWRVGYVVANEELISYMGKMQQTIASCLPGFVMKAAADAISGPQDAVEAMVKEYSERRVILLEGLSKVPMMKTFDTEGSFCTFINIKELLEHTGWTSQIFAENLLKDAGVLTCGGSVFGSMGEGYLRVCFANSKEVIAEGVKRIDQYVRSL